VKSTTFAVRIEPEFLALLDRTASARGVSRSDMVRAALTGVVDPFALDEARVKHLGRILLERLERDQEAVRRAVSQHDALPRAGREHER
jgi:Arc/MetJ-type ribon-helix-helix transcriptional regulator